MAYLLRVLTLLPLLTVAGCAATGPVDDDELGSVAYAPDTLVVQVSRTGGFLPAGAAVSSLPSVSVYDDGRVITPGGQIEIYTLAHKAVYSFTTGAAADRLIAPSLQSRRGTRSH